MSKRRTKKSSKKYRESDEPSDADFSQAISELGLDPNDYSISFQFTKGALTGYRGTVVEVTHMRTGRKAKKSAVSRTKREARKAILDVCKECLKELKAK